MSRKLKLFAVGIFLSVNIAADCLIISSPATDLEKVSGVDARAQSISKIYYDENSKMQIKGYATAYIEFFTTTTKNIQTDCKNTTFHIFITSK